MEELFALLQNLARSKFYGSLAIKLEAGKVVLLRKEETIKPNHNGETDSDCLYQRK
jgi:hypothetical protein